MGYYDEDWSDSFDDCDTTYWEGYLSGPDDDYFERFNDYDSTQEYE